MSAVSRQVCVLKEREPEKAQKCKYMLQGDSQSASCDVMSKTLFISDITSLNARDHRPLYTSECGYGIAAAAPDSFPVLFLGIGAGYSCVLFS